MHLLSNPLLVDLVLPEPLCPVEGTMHPCSIFFLWFERQIWMFQQLILHPLCPPTPHLPTIPGNFTECWLSKLNRSTTTGLQRPIPNKATREPPLFCSHKLFPAPLNVEPSRDGPFDGNSGQSLWTITLGVSYGMVRSPGVTSAQLLLYLQVPPRPHTSYFISILHDSFAPCELGSFSK